MFTPALQRFTEEELLRAPMVMEQAIAGVFQALQKPQGSLSPGERQVVNDLLLRLASHRRRVVDRYVASLREQINAEAAQRAPASTPAAPKRVQLSLVDDDEVAIDVAISHAIEAIRSVAEQELRELSALTAALAGDMQVARDHNPLRAESQGKALWTAAQALPLSRGHQVALVRHASMPLAEALRRAYASACSRLEAEGVEPAAYRTVIAPAGPRTERTLSPADFQAIDMRQLRATIPAAVPAVTVPLQSLEVVLEQAERQWREAPAGSGPTEFGRLREQYRTQLARSASSADDRQAIEWLARLFEAIVTDPDLTGDVQATLSRLQALAWRTALRDPAALDNHEHALWRFMDRFVYEWTVYAGPHGSERERLVAFVGNLVGELALANSGVAVFEWALQRLVEFCGRRLEERCAAVAAQVATMQHLDATLAQPGAVPSTFHGALDSAQLDTVPAALLDTVDMAVKPGADDSSRWLDARRAGDWLRVFRRGGWRHSQLLWPGDRGEVFLLADGDSDEAWAMRRGAALLLRTEGLIGGAHARSLVRDAARRVSQRLRAAAAGS
jgi:hypothetical protein